MVVILLCLIVGMLLSAFFSGSETGFYRASRLRFALDGMTGDPIAKGLLWFVNNPTLFVATTLIGNNLANYLVSFGIVLGTQWLLGGPHAIAEVVTPILLAPVIFVYGELLPKNLYYLAPNRLLRWGGPFFMLCAVLFVPFSILLWLFGRLLQHFVGEAPELVRLQLARHELGQLLDEGHEIGILQPRQRQIAQAVFDCGDDPLSRYSIPIHRVSTVTNQDPRAHVVRLARRQHASELLVIDAGTRKTYGFIQVVDVLLSDENWQQAIQDLPKFSPHATFLATVMRLQSERKAMGELVDEEQKTLGIVTRERLLQALSPEY